MKYAYRSIAEFVKHITDDSSPDFQIPFPELLVRDPAPTKDSGSSKTAQSSSLTSQIGNGLKSLSLPFGGSDNSSTELFENNTAITKEHLQTDPDLNHKASSNNTVTPTASESDKQVSTYIDLLHLMHYNFLFI